MHGRPHANPMIHNLGQSLRPICNLCVRSQVPVWMTGADGVPAKPEASPEKSTVLDVFCCHDLQRRLREHGELWETLLVDRTGNLQRWGCTKAIRYYKQFSRSGAVSLAASMKDNLRAAASRGNRRPTTQTTVLYHVY